MRWGEFVAERLARSGRSIRSLSRAISPADNNSQLASCIRGAIRKDGYRFRPTLALQAAIADELGLNDDERARLILLANLEHCPESIRDGWVYMERALLRADAAAAALLLTLFDQGWPR